MKHGQFIFADLSTYNLKKAQSFYENVFDWEFYSEDEQYFLAFSGNKQIIGLYETPQKFQEMKMPSFFMTYIQVENCDETVKLAKSLGAIIELEDTLAKFGKIALIRDPLGAGFTVYEGNKLDCRNHNISNSIVWNELFVSDLNMVKNFYQKLFHWKYKFDKARQRLDIYIDDENIGAIQKLEESLRSKYEYWGTFFEVKDVQETIKKIKQNGGTVLVGNEDYTSCTDFSKEAFFYLVEKQKKTNLGNKNSSKTSQIKYKAILVLVAIGISLFLSWYWIFGVLFLVWAANDIKGGNTYLFDTVHKKSEPILFWTIIAMWILLSLLSIALYT